MSNDPGDDYSFFADITYIPPHTALECCKDIRLIQVSQYSSYAIHVLIVPPDVYVKDPWHIDPWGSILDARPMPGTPGPMYRNQGPPYYPRQITWPPYERVSLPDHPGWEGPWNLHLVIASWEFETCAVCVEGVPELRKRILGCTWWGSVMTGVLGGAPKRQYYGVGAVKPALDPSKVFQALVRPYGFRVLPFDVQLHLYHDYPF
jgi:hypothetical protein